MGIGCHAHVLVGMPLGCILRSHLMRPVSLFLLFSFASISSASVYNLKIVTDANPDYTDLPSLVHSATSKWETPQEKCFAMFYWNHIARRQTEPMYLHGMA